MAQQKASAKKTKKASPAPAKKAASANASAKKSARNPRTSASASPTSTKVRGSSPHAAGSGSGAARNGRPETAAKSGKAASGLGKQDLQYFRNLLLEKRREILGDVGSMESEAFKQGSNLSNMPIHMADVGTDNFEQEFTLGLIESERQILREIQEALVRIDEGTFGVCQGTGKAIPRVRLEAVPWAKYTIEYSRALESGQVRRENGQAAEDEGGDEDEE